MVGVPHGVQEMTYFQLTPVGQAVEYTPPCQPKKWQAKNLYKFQKIKCSHKKDPYPLPFIGEMLNIVVRNETHFFLDGYSGYHQISIAPKDKYKIAFVIDWGAFIWKVILFGIKNEPPTY